MNDMGLQKETWNEKYLGMPVFVGHSKNKAFAYIKDRVWKRIQGWMEKMLSKAGKEILIKVCAQAILTYTMSVFNLTKGLCEQMTTMICRYFWAQQDHDKKIHWLSAEKFTLPKKDGGLDYKDLHTFNMAMLAKQGWRLLQNPDSLCGRVLKARYFPDTDMLHAEPREGISYTWRSILKGVQIIKQGIIKRVGTAQALRCGRTLGCRGTGTEGHFCWEETH